MTGLTPGAHASITRVSTEPWTMCFSRSRTLRTSLGSTPLIATPDSAPLPLVASISAKMKGWTASTSGSISRAVFITSRYSANEVCDLRTMTCALTPSTLSRNCFWKPVVTASTTVSADTPNTTPSTDTLVNTVNTENRMHTATDIRPRTTVSTPYGLAPDDSSRTRRPASAAKNPTSAPHCMTLSRLPP